MRARARGPDARAAAADCQSVQSAPPSRLSIPSQLSPSLISPLSFHLHLHLILVIVLPQCLSVPCRPLRPAAARLSPSFPSSHCFAPPALSSSEFSADEAAIELNLTPILTASVSTPPLSSFYYLRSLPSTPCPPAVTDLSLMPVSSPSAFLFRRLPGMGARGPRAVATPSLCWAAAFPWARPLRFTQHSIHLAQQVPITDRDVREG